MPIEDAKLTCDSAVMIKQHQRKQPDSQPGQASSGLLSLSLLAPTGLLYHKSAETERQQKD
jgi:hypothetical protein